jgi:hypothetical protein
VSIAEPLDSKLESVSTFSELASTPFPYKGMQKLVEDEGDNGIIYHLGADLTTWSVSVSENAQFVDGGSASSIYSPSQIIDGGNA